MDKPVAYIYHGECRLPTNAEIYTASMVNQRRDPSVRRNAGTVTRINLAECGITMEDDVFKDGFVRVDILSTEDFDPSSNYWKILASLKLTRTDFFRLTADELSKLYHKAVGEAGGKLMILYDVSPRYDYQVGDDRDLTFMLHLAQDKKGIEAIIRSLQEKDKETAESHITVDLLDDIMDPLMDIP